MAAAEQTPHRPVDTKQSFPDLELEVLERWRTRDVFAKSLAQRADAPRWGFYEGPPTANGAPGSHHVLARLELLEPEELRELILDAWLARAPARLAATHAAELGR